MKIKNKNSKETFPLGLDFFSFFIHELKSPLLSLKLKLDDLAMHSQKPEFKEALSSMETDLDRSFRFIHDALEMKEVENQASLNGRWLNWDEFLIKTSNKLEKWIFNEQIELEAPASGLEVFADPWWMESVVSNLLINAIQHSPRGGKITLKSNLNKEGGLFFSIEDQGPGLKEGVSQKIFHRFHSLRKSWPDSVFKGTGLGLFISRAVVEGHGGRIGVKSKRKGCLFYFTLPKAKETALKQAS